jgi:hypothetical protein
MISGLDELREANAVLQEVMDELRKQHIPFDEEIDVWNYDRNSVSGHYQRYSCGRAIFSVLAPMI